MRVGAGIAAVAHVGLDLDDAAEQTRPARELVHQATAQEIGGDVDGRTLEEGSAQRRHVG